MTDMQVLNRLLDELNEILEEDEQVEQYDILDASDNVEQAIEMLKAEIKSRK